MAVEPSGTAGAAGTEARASEVRRAPAAASDAGAAVAEVDLAALAHNAREAQRLAGDRALIAVVKADGYGHGALPVVRTLLDAGCRQLAVLTVEEAAVLRDRGVEASILLMRGALDAAEAREAVARGLTPVVHETDGLDRIAAAASRDRPCPVHVEVDTGMRRMGVAPDRAEDLLVRAAALDTVELEGAFTHFVQAEEPDLAPSLAQLEDFRRILGRAAERGARPRAIHAANSAGLLAGDALSAALPEATAVRPGLMLYGVRPAPHLDAADLRPVMTLRARVAAIQAVAAGESVGYGATWRAEAPSRVATLALGYADGIPWTAAERGRVWLAGAARPFTGRVSMDYTSVRIDDADVSVGDEAVFFGATPHGSLRVEEAAERAGTIPYELLVRVGARVPRRFRPAAPGAAAAV